MAWRSVIIFFQPGQFQLVFHLILGIYLCQLPCVNGIAVVRYMAELRYSTQLTALKHHLWVHQISQYTDLFAWYIVSLTLDKANFNVNENFSSACCLFMLSFYICILYSLYIFGDTSQWEVRVWNVGLYHMLWENHVCIHFLIIGLAMFVQTTFDDLEKKNKEAMVQKGWSKTLTIIYCDAWHAKVGGASVEEFVENWCIYTLRCHLSKLEWQETCHVTYCSKCFAKLLTIQIAKIVHKHHETIRIVCFWTWPTLTSIERFGTLLRGILC